MILVKYESDQKTYRLWEHGTRKIIIIRNVQIIENTSKQTTVVTEDGNSDSSIQNKNKENNIEILVQSTEQVGHHTRSKKRVQETSKDNIKDCNKILIAKALLAKEVPTTYDKAIKLSSLK